MQKKTPLIRVDWKIITEFIVDAFVGYGVPEPDAKIVADVLLESDKRGIESHGVNRFKPIYIDRIKAGIQNPATNIEVVKDFKATAVLDGHDGMGQVIGYRAMEMSIKKAKEYGIGMVVVRGSTHYGIAGYYVTMATKQNMLGITGTNARPSVAPTFGVQSMLGTNPLTFGFPTDENFPFVLDCATSTTQRGRIEHYARINKKTPHGHVITPGGDTITDSQQILCAITDGEAALTPLGGIGEKSGGYKGYGYGAVVEVLSAALGQGNFLLALNGFDADGRKAPHKLGHFFIAIDPEAFMGIDAFKKTCGNILRDLRASKKQPGQKRIYTPGEKEYLCWLGNKDKGVEINPEIQKELSDVRDELKLDKYIFPWEK